MLVSRLMSGSAPRNGPSGTAGASIEASGRLPARLLDIRVYFRNALHRTLPPTTSTECGGVEDGAGWSVQGGGVEGWLPADGTGARRGRVAVAPAQGRCGRRARAGDGRVRRADLAGRGRARGRGCRDQEDEPWQRRHRQGDHGEDQGRDRRREQVTPTSAARRQRAGARRSWGRSRPGGVPTWPRARLALTAAAPA